ncbi:MAG: exodeoxyribonuclease III [Alphaproteobacteria bacterium]|nr:exodeoxyribonuclease III [Alphaproteobacteria bacterium]MCL2889917.1 exodeoxyribonuclease III [Alphaproteobacteria bacterium]
MMILSININSIRAHMESFLTIAESGEYDTIIVQELKVEDNGFPHMMFEHLGYNIKVFGQKSWNGVAVFSKYSIEDVTRNMPHFADPSARMIECVIDGKWRLINVYMPNGESVDSPKFPYKIDWMNHFSDHIHKLLNSEEPVIIGGDFNVAIEDRDVWNPKQYEGSSISAPAARKIMQEWLDGPGAPEYSGGGWLDCYRKYNPDEENPWTWIGYRGGSIHKNHGLRLDYFITNHAASKHVKNCYIDMRPREHHKPTDHCGLVLEIA